MKNLKIYTASAGSGKTYQLALSYIQELFTDPYAYKKILAVTFTNKAATEMKDRILEKLSQLANGDPAAKGYADYLLKQDLVNSAAELEEKSRKILVNILHDYSSFYVQTIDSFFHWVIRGFTREIGLQSGYNLELDNNSILAEAVDLLIFSMEKDKQLKEWLVEFAEEKIMDGKSWDFSSDVFMLGKEVFKESYQSVQEEIVDPESRKEKYNRLKEKINKEVFSFENSMVTRAKEAMAAIEKAGLIVSDFKYGNSGPVTLFTKALNRPVINLDPSKRNRNGAEDIENWVKPGNPKEALVREIVSNKLQALLKEMLSIWDEGIRSYQTAVLLKKNIYSFGILNDISDRIREITKEKNLFLISDAPLFLKKIINNNDAPFIYEKAGNYFNRFMLDEFQDTSRFQWDNFSPLIQNGLSTGEKSVIVGDIKQSIYRWRNSDWKILATELEEKIPSGRMDKTSLNQNFRSAENIVKFNNSVFYQAKEVINKLISNHLSSTGLNDYHDDWIALIEDIYGEPRQKINQVSQNPAGFISQKFFEKDEKSEHREFLLNWIRDLVKDLQDRGYSAGDITFLVRSGREGREVAGILMAENNAQNAAYNFNVISNDSLYLANNSAVRFLIALLKFFNQSYDLLNLSFIKHEYLSYLSENSDIKVNWHDVFVNKKVTELKNLPDANFTHFTGQLDILRRLPLYELVERLISIFSLNRSKEKLAYVQAFQNEVLNFVRKESGDISAFLKHWENTGKSLTLNVSEAQDAIRIMTIHKAKGLEFKVVVLPFCDWNLFPETQGNRKTTLWTSTETTEYNEFSHLPVVYGSSMRNSHFIKDFYEETFRAFVDNLNLLYVAFTRAKYEIHSLSRLGGKNGEIKNTGDLLYMIFNNYSLKNDPEFPEADLNSLFDIETRQFKLGNPEVRKDNGESGDLIKTNVLEEYPVNFSTKGLSLNHKNIYLSDLKEDDPRRTGYGTQMHEILADIKTAEDADNALRKAWLKGLLDSEEKNKLSAKINRVLQDEPFRDWFSGNWRCKTESDLYNSRGKILRPDRVMISEKTAIVLDYKFGDEIKSTYHDQVKEYGMALKEAGFETIKLFLWYFNLEELVKVEL